MLLDLQIVRYAPPATDLNYFFFTSMTGEVRKPNTEAFLNFYYSAFRDIMEDAGQKVPFTQAQKHLSERWSCRQCCIKEEMSAFAALLNRA